MSTLILTLLACGGATPAPKAPEVTLEDFMQTCMGSGDCAVVSTGCCNQGAVAVNKANVEAVQGKALPEAECANVTCDAAELPKVECKAAKCVLVE